MSLAKVIMPNYLICHIISVLCMLILLIIVTKTIFFHFNQKQWSTSPQSFQSRNIYSCAWESVGHFITFNLGNLMTYRDLNLCYFFLRACRMSKDRYIIVHIVCFYLGMRWFKRKIFVKFSQDLLYIFWY